ncbi:flagellar motor protein PomA [Photobacterium iliopiscarium]|uniref:Flagellar motor protein PomA n=1 Tax=Photobacterium iliopiscarium TaxID=56192 RepID=A0A0D8PVI4_9GAMM|nr:flagellar motor protein PomA [Photobacterium iliopiscarium]KJG21189.1 flagellar motor protein PomA [Photobacterium iliopiscarium]PST96875.1 flagellar motor protein PomA [Photobacterium iliopiscarium]PSU02188.1 flagellar motor protein PomA [Photobacterium iliopiscarium]PSV84537.1 flagellar motor protein PomA [Photobacterium iliopiscarium]PSV98991.1 flagellar motor protein PomA [Photobacterium iliopiscarium]
MDLATLIGLVGSFAFIIMAMLVGGDLVMFADTSSVLIVFGGSLFIVLMKYNISQFFGAAKIAAKAFIFKTDKPDDLIAQIVTMSDAARKGGFLALEEMEVENPFLRKGIDLLVDGHDADTVRMILRKDIALTNERHEQGASIFSALGDVAPAMGMIGTLIGLVAMLSNMDDPKSIGPAMAVALLTTLYGSILANMVALPIADKLMLRKNEERLNRLLILDGVLAIQEGQNPRVIDSYLKNYLHEKKRRLNFDE